MALTDYQRSRLDHINNDRPLKPKKIYTIPKVSAKRAEKEKQQQKIIIKPKKSGCFDSERIELDGSDEVQFKTVTTIVNEMDLFWKNAEKVIDKTKKCWECGDFISPSDYRNSTAHIFPKSENSGFPSVASNEWNFVVAGVRCGCHNKTHRLDTFSKMSIFPTAVARFHKFSHLITERKKYLDLFIEYANALI